MKSMHRIIAFMLVLVMSCADSGIAALAQGVLTMPTALKIIDEEAFYGSTSIDKVTLPEGVTEIRDRAFANSTLSEINLPASLEYIADDAFEGCNNITARVYPDTIAEWYALSHDNIDIIVELSSAEKEKINLYSFTTNDKEEVILSGYHGTDNGLHLPKYSLDGKLVTKTADKLFSGNSDIVWVDVPGTYKELGQRTFENCTSLQSVYINEGVKILGWNLFSGCTSLTEVVLPNSIDYMFERLFENCNSLQEITYPLGMATPPADRNWTQGWAYKHASAFYGSKVQKVYIPYGATTIMKDAFWDATSVKDIYIPETVVSFGPNSGNSGASNEPFKNIKSSVTIHGVTGSAAETYAKANSIKFVDDYTILPTEILLSTLSLNLVEGEKGRIKATVFPENATNKDLTWHSSDETIISVEEGVVTAKSEGKAYVEITTCNGLHYTCFVTVTKANESMDIPAESISIFSQDDSFVFTIGNTMKLSAVIEPDNATDKTVIWSSSDESIATVSADGIVFGISSGNCIVTATTANGLQAQIAIHVVTKAESIKIIPETVSLYPDETYSLYISVQPEDAYIQELIWYSNDETIATVDDGVITAHSSGEVIISCTTSNGLTASTHVTVLSDIIAINGKTNETWNIINGLVATQSFDVSVTYNVEASSDVDWLTAVLTNGALIVQADNFIAATAQERTGIVTLTNEKSTATLTVKQSSIIDIPTIKSPSLSTNENYPTEMPLGAFNLDVERSNTGSYLVYAVYQKDASGKYNYMAAIIHNPDNSILPIPPTGNTYTLIEGKTYRFDVMEMTESFANNTSFITTQTVKTSLYVTFVAPKAPDYPRGVYTELLNDGIKVSWNAVNGANGYYIRYNDSSATVTGGNTSTYTIPASSLSNGTVYNISVASYNDAGDSDIYGSLSVSVYWYHEILPTDITFTNASAWYEMRIGERATIKTTVTPSEATNHRLIWASSNNNAVVVDQNGTIVAVGLGTATITAVSDADSSVKKSFETEVVELSLTRPRWSSSYPKVIGDNTISLKWTGGLSNGDETEYYSVWRSLTQNGEYALIDDGLTTRTYTDNGVKAGTTYYYKILAYAYDGTSGVRVNSSYSTIGSVTTTGTQAAEIQVTVNDVAAFDGGNLGTYKPGVTLGIKFTYNENTKRIFARVLRSKNNNDPVAISPNVFWQLDSTDISDRASYTWTTTIPSDLSNGDYILWLVGSPYSEMDTSHDSSLDQSLKQNIYVNFTVNKNGPNPEPDPNDIASISISALSTNLQEDMFASITNQMVAVIEPSSASNAKVVWTSSNTSIFNPIPQSDSKIIQFTTGTVSKPTNIILSAKAGSVTNSTVLTIYDRPAIKINGTAVSRQELKEYDIRNGDLTISWTTGIETPKHQAYTAIYTIEPDLSLNGSGSENGRLTVNYDDYYNIGNTSFTIPASVLTVGQYVKIAVKSYDCSWTTIGIHIIDSYNPMKSVTISGSKTFTMNEGDLPKTLSASYAPYNATDNSLSWKSSNSAVVSVEGNGKSARITPLKPGSARITVYNSKNANIEDYVDVTVNQIALEPAVSVEFVDDYFKGNLLRGQGEWAYFEWVINNPLNIGVETRAVIIAEQNDGEIVKWVANDNNQTVRIIDTEIRSSLTAQYASLRISIEMKTSTGEWKNVGTSNVQWRIYNHDYRDYYDRAQALLRQKTSAEIFFDEFFSHSSSENLPYLALNSAYASLHVYHYLDNNKLQQFLSERGFIHYECYDWTPLDHSVGVVIAMKYIVDDSGGTIPLFAILIRGSYGKNEWISNFNIGTSGNSYGFATAANRVYSHFVEYVSLYAPNIDVMGNYKLWITGHSRGGGVGNLLASNQFRHKSDSTYVYLFATPLVLQKSKVVAVSNTFNYIMEGDIVPCVPFKDWGFGRSGQDITLHHSGKVGSRDVLTESDASWLCSFITDIIKNREDYMPKYTGVKIDILDKLAGNIQKENAFITVCEAIFVTGLGITVAPAYLVQKFALGDPIGDFFEKGGNTHFMDTYYLQLCYELGL